MEAARNVVSDQDLTPFLRQKFAKWWGMVKLGHDGVMLNRIQRQQKAAEKIADISMKGTNEGVDSLYPTEDDMAVQIGNEIHYHYESPPTDTTAAVTPPVTPEPLISPSTTPVAPTTPAKSPIWPLILVGAIGLSGLGGSFLAYQAAHKPVPAQVIPPSTDNVTDVTFPK